VSLLTTACVDATLSLMSFRAPCILCCCGVTDGSYIDTTGVCSGQSGSCRNNPSCQCEVSVGPVPQGTYTLGNMRTFKGMDYCYDLYPASSNNMCGRSGFLIHGGGCSGNPSEGCIVVEDSGTRYKIKSGATLHVTA
jgi:hypothetical protein